MSETESLMLRILESIQKDLREVKAYLETGFAAVLKQGDRRFLDHEGRIRTLEREMRSTKAELRLGFKAVNKRLDSHDRRLDGVDAELKTVHGELADIKGLLVDMGERLPPKR